MVIQIFQIKFNVYQNENISFKQYKYNFIGMSTIASQLKQIKSQGSSMDLHSHIKQIISSMVINKHSLQDFEQVSFTLPKKLSAQQKPAPSEVVFKIRQAYAHIQQYQKKTRQLAGKINIGTQDEPQQPASLGYVPDLMQEARVFQKFGLGFGETQTYLIFKALSRFAQKKNAKQVRFWGKILGREKDYYVAEGQADTTEQEGELPPGVEPKGTGANKVLYWVCTELTGEWTELPVITPQQLQISRKIKYLFTGNLSKDILTNPDFPGKQSHLLKCQLVRINTTCSIVPKGMYITNAQDPKQIQSPEQYTYPSISLLAQKQSWVYQHPSLLKNGRTTLLKPQGLQPQQQQKALKQLQSQDPSQPRLKPILLDNANWSLLTNSLSEMYLGVGKNAKMESKGAVGIRNLLWPGWLTVAYGSKQQSVYVGYANKMGQRYYPKEPENVLTERQDKEEYEVKE